MRSCIYCGRELEKGEVCDCPQSVPHRAGNSNHLPKRKNETKTEDKKSDKNKRKHRLITVIRIKPKLLTKQAMPERKVSLKEQR